MTSRDCHWKVQLSPDAVPLRLDQNSLVDSSLQTQPTTAESKVRILIADDRASVRKAVRNILELKPSFQVVGEALDGGEAVELAKDLQPDVVILNVQMPVHDGIEAARIIKIRSPRSAVVILSSNADRILVEAAKTVGARAYVAKMSAGKALISAIERAVAGGDFLFIE
jgi:DNA-binding NarL/FixJ family response regulator